MPLILQNIQETISDASYKCEALSMMFAYFKSVDPVLRLRHLDFLIKNKPVHINQNQPYLQIEVLDTDSGEILEMKALKHIHEYNIAKHIYPEYLRNLFL